MGSVRWSGLFNRIISRLPGSIGSSVQLYRQTACFVAQQPASCLHLSFSFMQHGRRCTSTLQSSKQTDKSSELFAGSDISTGVPEEINALLRGGDAGRLFAVVHVAGKQRKITTEDIIILDKPIAADVGERIRLNKVLLVGGKDFTVVGRPILGANQVKVEATVIEKTLSHTKIMFWYHKRENHRVFRLHKESLTVLRINDIDVAALDHS